MSDLNYLINFDSDTTGIRTAEKGLNTLSSAIAALGLGLGIKELAETADAYTTLAARIKVAVGETGNVQQAMAGVQQIALATNSDLNATASLFSKIADVGKQMGLSQQQSLDLTKTINQAMQLSGGSAQAANASITQLSQALASGVLRGDEFNSVSEQAPEIMNALARSLNVTKGELRKMAEEGKLSSQVLVKALQGQADEVEAKFRQFPKTIGQALQNIKTQWEVVVGEFNADSGASAVVVNALQIIGDNLGLLKNLFSDVGDGITWMSDQFGKIDPSTIATLKDTLSQAYDTVKDLTKSIGEMGVTAWEAFKSLLDSITPVFSAFTSGKDEISGLDGAMRVLQVGMGLLSDGAKGLSIILNGLVGGLQFVAGGLSALQAKVAGFMGFDDVAKQAETASDRLFAAGEKSFARANQQIMDFKSSTRQALDEMQKTEEQKNAEAVADTQKTLADKTKAWQDFVLAEKNWAKERADLEAQLQQARQAGNEESIAKIKQSLTEIDTAEQASAKQKTQLEKDKLEAVQASAQAQINTNKGVADEQLKAQLAMQGYALEVDKAGKASVKAMEDTANASKKVGLSLKDTALNAAKGLGVDVPLALNQINQAFKAQIESVNQVADGYNQLKKEGMDAGALLNASLDKLLAGAKSQKEIDTVRQMYVQFGKDGKLSTAQVEQGIDGINKKLEKSPELMDATAKALKDLGIISKAEAEKQAQDQINNYNLAKQAFDKGLISASQMQQALEKTSGAVETSGNAQQQAWLQSQASAVGLTASIEQNGKISLQTADQIAQANAKVAQSHSEVGSAIDKNTENLKQQAEEQAKVEQAQQASVNRMMAWVESVRNAVQQPINDLQELGVSAEQSTQAFEKLNEQSFFVGQRWADFQSWGDSMRVLGDEATRQANAYRTQYEAVTNVTDALGEATANTDTLAQAQQVLEQATNANTFALIKLDNEKLENLQKAIDDTRYKMDGLAESAKNSADNLEAELARMDGDDSLARKLEQTRKLEEAQNKLNEARQRGNQAEIEQYERALTLQQKINDKENQQAQAKVEETKRKEAETAQKAQAKADTPTTTATNQTVSQTSQPTVVTTTYAQYLEQPVTNVTANEVVSELMKKSVEVGKQAMLTQIREEIKRQPF